MTVHPILTDCGVACGAVFPARTCGVMLLVDLQERHKPRTGLHSLTPDNSMSARRRGAHSSRVSRQRSSWAALPPRVAHDVPLRVYPRASDTRFDAWLSMNASLDASRASKPSKARWRIAARAS